MEIRARVQIQQCNDPEILEFFNEHGVKYRLVGDHLFIVRSRGRDAAAGPGDWLASSSDGEIDVQRSDYGRRARRARQAGREQDADDRATASTPR